MEYLTLQDIPHRQYNSIQSHRMASQPAERPLGSMHVAVSDSQSSHLSNSSRPFSDSSRRLPLPPIRSLVPSLSRESEPLLPTEHIPSLDLNEPGVSTIDSQYRSDPAGGKRKRPAMDDPSVKEASRPIVRHYVYRHLRNSKTAYEDDLCDLSLTNSQNAQMRSSPPIQPNEHGFNDKLPSFSEVKSITRRT